MVYSLRIKDKETGVIVSKIAGNSLTEISLKYANRYSDEDRACFKVDISTIETE